MVLDAPALDGVTATIDRITLAVMKASEAPDGDVVQRLGEEVLSLDFRPVDEGFHWREMPGKT